MSRASSFAGRRMEWRQRWQQRPRHERTIILALAALVVLTVFWLWIWTPINRHLQQLNAQLPQARAQLDTAQEQWRESAGLSRQKQEAYTTDARTAFMNVAERFSLTSSIAALEMHEQQIDCTLASLPFATLVALIDALQNDASFYVVNTTITPLSQNGAVRVELTLARPN